MSDPLECHRQKINDSLENFPSREDLDHENEPVDIFDLCTVNRVEYLDPNNSEADSRSDLENSSELVEGDEVIAVQHNNDTEHVQPQNYSVNMSSLASAFETLKMDKSMKDESFVSCNNDPIEQVFIVDSLSDDKTLKDETFEFENQISVSKDEPFDFKNQLPVFELEHNKSPNENKINIVSCSPAKSDEPGVINEAKKEAETPVKPLQHGIKRCSHVSNDSPGVQISPLKFESPRDPKADLWQAEYDEIMKSSSVSPLAERYAQYEEYSKLKLEVNQIQQQIAILMLQRKQKEGKLIELHPGKVKFVSKKLALGTEDDMAEKERLKLQVEELKQRVETLEIALQIVKNENYEVEEHIERIQENMNEDEHVKIQADKVLNVLKLRNVINPELNASKEENNKLKAAIAKADEAIESLTSQLAAVTKKYVASEKMLENLRTTLGLSLGKHSSE